MSAKDCEAEHQDVSEGKDSAAIPDNLSLSLRTHMVETEN